MFLEVFKLYEHALVLCIGEDIVIVTVTTQSNDLAKKSWGGRNHAVFLPCSRSTKVCTIWASIHLRLFSQSALQGSYKTFSPPPRKKKEEFLVPLGLSPRHASSKKRPLHPYKAKGENKRSSYLDCTLIIDIFWQKRSNSRMLPMPELYFEYASSNLEGQQICIWKEGVHIKHCKGTLVYQSNLAHSKNDFDSSAVCLSKFDLQIGNCPDWYFYISCRKII